MDNSPKAAEIIAEHERDVARLRRGLAVGRRAVELLLAFVVIYALAMLAVGFGQ